MKNKKVILNFIKINIFILTLFLSGCASFQLNTFPENVEIYEEEKMIGETPYKFDQFSGERKFTLKKPGYVEKELTISSLGEKSSNIKLEKVKENYP